MQRSALDKLIASTGLIVAVALFAAAAGLCYAHKFVHGQVKEQLAAQRITFPEAGPAIDSLALEADRKAVSEYAGQQLLTGAQAKVFANNYINAHLQAQTQGKTYSELSTESRANPSDAELAALVQTAFRGETLRGLLLNAYAFDTMATIARFAAVVAATAGVALTVLSVLGFRHGAKAAKKSRR